MCAQLKSTHYTPLISKALFLLSLCALQATSQILTPGPCPTDVTVEQEFDLAAYLGRWYEYKRYPFFQEANGTCVTATYTTNPNGTVAVRNYQVDEFTGEDDVALGYATLDSDSGEGKLLVSFPFAGDFNSPYWVLDTDYKTFSVVWSCYELGENNFQNSWVLTRERFPDDLTVAIADLVIAENNLQEAYEITKHELCPADPLP